MRLYGTIYAFYVAVAAASASAQAPQNVPALLGRDVVVSGKQTEGKADGVKIATVNVEQNNSPAVGDKAGVFIGGVNITGAETIDRANYAAIIDGFVGRTIARDELPKLARSVADRTREQGYIFASAVVPIQSVALGVVTVAIDQGSVSEVRIIGSQNRKVRKIVAGIVGDAVRKETVERLLLLAGDVPGITVVGTRYVRENGRGVLVVTVREDRARGAAYVDNFGGNAFGPVRVRLEIELSSLLTDGDSLTTQTLVTPADPRELVFVTARYAAPINNAGTQVALTAAAGRTQPGGGEGIGHTRYAAFSATHSIVRANAANLWINAEVAYLTVEQDLLGLLAQRDNIVTFSLFASGNARFAGGRIAGGVGIVQGLPFAGATGLNDPLSSRGDGTNDFTKTLAWISWNRDIGGGFGLNFAANGQIASAPLLAAQEIGLGGPSVGRGYNFSERFGDGGILGTAELRKIFVKPVPHVDWARLNVFADGGYVYNLGTGFGGGALASAGAGVRAGIGKAEFGIEAAFPLTDPRLEGNTKSPRINLSAGYRF